jgi:hypothetical protein
VVQDSVAAERAVDSAFHLKSPSLTVCSAACLHNAVGLSTSVTLKWEGGWWAHKYNIYLDTTPTFSAPRVVDFMPGAATAGARTAKESFALTGLRPSTTYYWKIVSKTMAEVTKSGPTWHFTTGPAATP